MSSHKRSTSSDERPKNFPRLFGRSPAQSTHVLANQPPPSTSAPPSSSTLPQAAVLDPSSDCSAFSKVQSPDPITTRSGCEAFRQFLASASGLLQVGPLQPVINDLAEFYEVYKDTVATDSDYAVLKTELEALLEVLNTSFTGRVPPILDECIGDLHCSINEELDKISGREREWTGRRLWEADKDLSKVRTCRDRIHGHVNRVTLKIVRGHGEILTQHDIALGEHANRLDEQARFAEEQTRFAEAQGKSAEERGKEEAAEKRLEALKPSLTACYNSSKAATLLRRECTPNTRKEVLSDLVKWRQNTTQGNIFWMNGMAGTGQTTIANTLCATLDTEQRLGASFFCTRQLPECRNVNMILPTIAYQLARLSPHFRMALSLALERDPDIPTKSLQIQLQGLIISPLDKISEPLPTDLVVVIDALDECEDRDGVGQILGLLVNHASELPIKVFVSSRPEEQIRRNVGSMSSQLVLHELDNKIVKGDIEIYLRAELEGVSVSESQLLQLVERAGVLFIYAATAIRYIKAKKFRSSQQERVKTVLDASATPSSNKNKDIDALYSAVLASAFNNPDLEQTDLDRMRLVLHTVVCVQEPLTADAMAEILQLENGELVLEALEPLWSVLHVSGSEGTSLVTTLHASFPDYMFDAQRSNEHCCDVTSHHGQLAGLCFDRIDRNERLFNICGLESSYLFDDQVSDLDDKVRRSIPLDLSYACQYWVAHLELGGSSSERIQLLENFLMKRLLLWMEVLNLKKRMNIGAVLLERARKCCTNGGGSEATQGLIHDAWRFVTMFAANPVSRSTPHIYVSMLASWPNSKLIKPCYVERAGARPEVGGSGMYRRQLALLGVFTVGSEVYSVAFSPDGTRIICGCFDKTIRVWDARSGKKVLGPLKGHTDWVNSVAYSPGGHHIASSGSRDKTIRVWDAWSGKAVLEPLEGHTDRVRSVVFSPDSTRIVSGSDATVRVWDAQTGKMVLGPLEGHTSGVLSVAFSPNGIHVVSGSTDNTIRVWDSQRGRVVLGPLEGHIGSVESVSFSSDSTRIVSVSSDKTIRVWNAQTGETILGPLEGRTIAASVSACSPDGMHIVSGGSYDPVIRVWDVRGGQVVLGPLEGHTRAVTSVTFSPDGMRVVSGSDDATIRVWDVQGREVSLEPSDGHTESARSVAFAPDGMRIASGSADHTIRVWETQSGKMVLGPLKGHTEVVSSVAFSPDNERIVSGSYDNTIRVWDSRSGKVVLGPLEGHTNWVRSVTFSPDGTRIVSGSDDCTICVWDSQSGNMVLGPLNGHSHYGVRSVVVSPDGRQIVSGAGNKTVHVWDAQNGKVVIGPLRGHAGWVYSVALSPDSTRIVSGSGDNTLRVWNAQTGKMVLGPLEGHTGCVNSVVFSPDGMYIVSGSDDKTIRIWNAQTGELVWGPLYGHTLSVASISCSPDSTHIASSSFDKVIRVWRLPSRLATAYSTPSSPATPSPFHAISGSKIHQPSLSDQTSSGTPLPWTINEDGWVVDENQHLWLWVPLDLRAALMVPDNTVLISTKGSIQINFDRASIGEFWVKCYIPA